MFRRMPLCMALTLACAHSAAEPAPCPPPAPLAMPVDVAPLPSAPVAAPAPARAPPPFFHEPLPDPPASALATRFAELTLEQCKNEVRTRQLAVVPKKGASSGVASPYRIIGPLRGVRFVAAAAPSPFGVLDCRLALALDELAQLLVAEGVVELRVDSMYRPHARRSGHKLSQHAYGLAIDILTLKLQNGRELRVDRDWHAPLGSVACGPDAVMEDPSDDSIALRNVLCKVAASGIFHHLLTPSYDAAHRSHFHFDIQRRTKKLSARAAR